MSKLRLAIVGVGNCASSLIQGLEYYKDANHEDRVPGLMHVELGGYHVRDIEIVAAFDVDAKKVGKDVAEAIFSEPNNTIRFADWSATAPSRPAWKPRRAAAGRRPTSSPRRARSSSSSCCRRRRTTTPPRTRGSAYASRSSGTSPPKRASGCSSGGAPPWRTGCTR